MNGLNENTAKVNGEIEQEDQGRKCNFNLTLMGVNTYVDNTGVKKITYNMNVECNYQAYQAEVHANKVSNFSWIRNLTNALAYFDGDKKDFEFFISDLLEKSTLNVPQLVIFEPAGWYSIPGVGYRYIYEGGVIGDPNINNVSAPGYKMFPDFTILKTHELFTHILGMRSITYNKNLASVALIYNILGMLTTPFKLAGCPVKFVLGFIGMSNSRKTSVAMNILNGFNRDKMVSPTCSFTSTMGGIEEKLHEMKDSVLIIDDMMPSKDSTKQREINNKFEFIVRLIGDGTVKHRMTRNSSAQFQGLCAITGEFEDGVTSSISRMVSLPFERNTVNNEVLEFYQENPQLLDTFMYDFLDFFTRNFDQGVMLIRENFLNYRKEAQSMFKQSRFCEAYAHCKVAVDILIQYFASNDYMDLKSLTILRDEFYNAIMEIIRYNDKKLAAGSVPAMFVEAFNEAVEKNIITFQKLDTSGMVSNGKYNGFIDDYHFYVTREDAFRLFNEYWKPFLSSTSVANAGVLVSHLTDCKLVKDFVEGNVSRNTYKLPRQRISNRRFLYIDREQYYRLLKEYEILGC